MKESTSFWLKVAGVVIPLLGLVATYHVNQPADRDVEWSVVGHWKHTSLPSRGLQLSLQEHLVDSVDVLRLRMKNTGEDTIHPSDFGGPVYVEFEKGTTIYDVYRCTTSYADCEVIIDRYGKNGITLTPALLNPGDYFSVQFITSPVYKAPNVDQRIAGINDRVELSLGGRVGLQFADRKTGSIGEWIFWLAAIFALIAHIASAYLSLTKYNTASVKWWKWLLIAVMLIFGGYIAWFVQSMAFMTTSSPLRNNVHFWPWVPMIAGYLVLIGAKDLRENLKDIGRLALRRCQQSLRQAKSAFTGKAKP